MVALKHSMNISLPILVFTYLKRWQCMCWIAACENYLALCMYLNLSQDIYNKHEVTTFSAVDHSDPL